MPDSYEDQQRKLQTQSGLSDGEDDGVHIEIPKEPEVNPEIYLDVEQLLFRGFIARVAEINGVPFVFKSINHHEFETLRWLSGTRETSQIRDRFYNSFLAYGVYMVNGQNVLSGRDNHLPELTKFFAEMPREAKAKTIWNLSEINRKATNAVTLTEAYAMEVYSRFRWAQLKGIDLCSTTTTGIPGSECLGLNVGQLVWRALNHYEDLKETTEREWEHAKFVGSCMAGKGVSKVYNQDKTRRAKEREDRAARKDKLLRQVVLGEDKSSSTGMIAGRVKIVANTVEELTEQLERDLRGEKDWHDEVVAAEEARIRNLVDTRQKQLIEISEQREKEFNGRMLLGGTSNEYLTPEEVQERMIRGRQIQNQSRASRIIYPDLMDPKTQKFHEKWGSVSQPQETGPIAQTDRDPSSALPITRPEPRGQPFRKALRRP